MDSVIPVVDTVTPVLDSVSTTDFQPLIDFLTPYLVLILFNFGIVIALLLVILFAKGWQSNGR